MSYTMIPIIKNLVSNANSAEVEVPCSYLGFILYSVEVTVLPYYG